MNKNELDEMQKEKRNKIGNQMFMLMFYVLFIDCGLSGVGIHWLKYPANIMVIIMIFMSIYLVRTIAANAYLPPKTNNKKNIFLTSICIIFAALIAIGASKLIGKFQVSSAVNNANDNSALILLIVSSVGLIISLIVILIKNNNEKNISED